MNLSKSELMQSMWVSVEKRWPDPKGTPVLVYNEETGVIRQPFMSGLEFDIQYTKDVLSGKAGRPRDSCISACEFTHWMPIYPPEKK